jgi:RNA polymerase sigma factor (sigma-70 family)
MSYMQTRQYSVPEGLGVPDGVLVGQALAGDQCAFDILVRRYQRLLVSYIHSFLKDGEQVYDVLQHVFFKLYVSLPILLTNVSLKGWLFQVARNRCLDELRMRYRRIEIPFSTFDWKYHEEELSPIEAITDPDPLPEEVALDRVSALLQATELLGNRAYAQHARDNREDLLLPLSATLAYSAREQRTFCSHLVV